MIHLIRERATPQQLTEMLEALEINIRPCQGNPSMVILDPETRERVEEVTRQLLGDVAWVSQR